MDANKMISVFSLVKMIKNDVINLPSDVIVAPIIEKIEELEKLLKED